MFQRTEAAPAPSLTLTAGTLAVRPLAPLFTSRWMKLVGAAHAAANRIARRLRGCKTKEPAASLAGTIGRAWSVPVAKASTLADKVNGARALIRYGEDPRAWSPAAQRLWSRMAADMRAKLTPPIPVAADSTIVVVLDRASALQFERNRRSWNFAGNIAVVVAGAGAAVGGLCSAQSSDDIVALPQEIASDPRRLMRTLLDRVRTDRVILLPGSARPLPGASLFTAPAWSAAPIALHSTIEVKRANSAVPLPWRSEPLLFSAATDYLDRLCGTELALLPNEDLRSWMRKAVVTRCEGWEICNVESWGWRAAAAEVAGP
jgi:hypothetical protein